MNQRPEGNFRDICETIFEKTNCDVVCVITFNKDEQGALCPETVDYYSDDKEPLYYKKIMTGLLRLLDSLTWFGADKINVN